VVTINAENITVGRDFNIESSLSASDEVHLKEIEDKIKIAAEKGDKPLVKKLVEMALNVSQRIGEALAVRYLMS
jgi:hypothetical protein